MRAIWESRTGRSALVLFAITLLVHFLESRGHLHGLQMALSLDPLVRVTATPKQMDVSVVTIDEEDYRQYFCGRSPLDGRALLALVKGVQDTLHPQVIGVDIDTADWNGEFPSCPDAEKLLCKEGEDKASCLAAAERLMPAEENAPSSADKNPLNGVVWAQVPAAARVVTSEQEWWAPLVSFVEVLWTGEPEDATALPLRTVAGHRIPPDVYSTGIPQFPLDPDGVVRRYRRRLRVIDDRHKSNGGQAEPVEMDSMPYALVRALGPSSAKDKNASGETFLRFLTGPEVLVPIEAKYLMPPLQGEKTSVSSEKGQVEKVLKMRPNRIVLIGGTYREARDTYRTPLGEMPGVQLVAQAVETELQGGFREINSGFKMFADLLVGWLLIWLWSLSPKQLAPWVVFGLSLGGVFCLAWLIGVGLFTRWGIWFDSVPIVVGVLIHQIIEELNKVGELKEEVDDRDQRIRELEQDLKVLAAGPAHAGARNPRPPNE